MGSMKNAMLEAEIDRTEKIIESYPPEIQEQIYAGTWQNSAQPINAGRAKPKLIVAQSQGSKAPKCMESCEVKAKPTENANKGLLTPAEVGDLLNVKVSTVYSWVSTEQIPFVKLGRLIRFDFKDVMAWVGKQKHQSRLTRSYEVKLPANGHDL